MGIQKAVWLASIVAVVSTTVSVATVCVVLPKAVSGAPAEEPVTLPVARPDDPRARELAAEKDREAIDTIKDNLDINVFAGTVFEDDDTNEQPETKSSAEDIASQALSDTANQLHADGQHRAAELVRAAAAEFDRDPIRAAAAESPTKSR